MKRCASCNTPIEHMHGNSVYCHKCREDKKEVKHKSADNFKVSMTMKEFAEIGPKIELADKIALLNGYAKEVVMLMLEKSLKDQEGSHV